MRKIPLIIAILCLGLSVGCSKIGLEETKIVVKVNKSLDPEVVETRLVKWVYDHSNKISMKTAKIIVDESMKTNKPLLILALSQVESEFVPTAVSNMGAKGITQVMWKYHGTDLIKAGICKEERDLFDPDISIKAGNFVLDGCLKQGVDIEKALKAYLGGKDGFYKNRITENLANLYLLANLPDEALKKPKEAKPETKKSEVKTEKKEEL
jgi:hypothetical protein